MAEQQASNTQVVRAGVERACKEFTTRVTSLGFARTKKMLWTRRRPFVAEFIDFFRCGSSYGAPSNASVEIRVSFGIRVLNDSFVALALNGPWSDNHAWVEGRYHLRFNARTDSQYERCVDDLARFVQERGEPWFERFSSIQRLLDEDDSPIEPEAKRLLAEAVDGHETAANTAASLKLLGIRDT